ncbi:hypothetical protein J6590_056045 [Homalodisca vitripennis]|nr:hypothetical protein J6590_056045 [Homalodisca vitripennis]
MLEEMGITLMGGYTDPYHKSWYNSYRKITGSSKRRAWLLLGWVTAERSCPCKQAACPAVGLGSEVTFKPLVPRLSVREGFLALISPGKIRHLYFTLLK